MYELPTITWLTERIRPLLSPKSLYLRLFNFVAQKMIYSHFSYVCKAKLFCKMAGTMPYKSLVAFKSWELNYACFVSIGKRDCEVSEWSDWGPCEPACGVGVSKRTRTVIFAPLNGGKECPPLTEKKGCLNKICGREAGKDQELCNTLSIPSILLSLVFLFRSPDVSARCYYNLLGDWWQSQRYSFLFANDLH